MHTASRRIGRVLALVAVVAAPLDAQVRYDTPGTRVEILGLERWTRRMLEDSIAHYAPGQTLASAACMATLKQKLKFGDALVAHYQGFSGPNSDARFLSVRVVEPSRTAASMWRKLPADAYPSLLPAYAPVILPVTDDDGGIWPGRLFFGLQFSDSAIRTRILAQEDSTTQADYARISGFLETHRAESDRQRALRVLDSSSAYGNRMAAALLLSNFPANDSTWYALVRALRDPHESVRSAAGIALDRLPRRPVNWAPVTTDLRALLGGANLAAMETVMSLLADTKVAPSLTRALLYGNDAWTMRLLTAEAPMAPQKAKGLLVALNGGTDLGKQPGPWRAWIASRR